MATTTSIEWTEQTWNPTTGCDKVSPGCTNCYAERIAKRLKAMGASGYETGFDLSLMQDRLEQPLKRKKPTMYFVNSMSDLFHEKIPFDFIDKVFSVIENTKRHTYQILTKRSKTMREYFSTRIVPGNVWLGVSVENKKHGLPRIDDLRHIDARIKFISCEPLLEGLGIIDLTYIHWVIVGGESGPKARIMRTEWVEPVKNQCKLQGVAFFFKQWGMWGSDGVRRNTKANGRVLAGRMWNNYPATICC